MCVALTATFLRTLEVYLHLLLGLFLVGSKVLLEFFASPLSAIE